MRAHTVLVWFGLNLAIPTAFLALGAGMGGLSVQSEVGPGGYEVLADNWPRISPSTHSEIAATLARDGRISQWAYKSLFDDVMHDAGGVVMSSVDSDRQSARERLLVIARDGREAARPAPPASGVNNEHPLSRHQ